MIINIINHTDRFKFIKEKNAKGHYLTHSFTSISLKPDLNLPQLWVRKFEFQVKVNFRLQEQAKKKIEP